MTAPNLPESTNTEKEEDEELAYQKTMAIYGDTIIQSLPKEKGWQTEGFLLHPNYWLYSAQSPYFCHGEPNSF